MVQRVKDILAVHQVTVWDGVKPNPDLQDLDAATKSLRGLNIGCVVGLGGGSALDAAKVLASTIPSPDGPTLLEVFRSKALTKWASRLPLVAIPTTSGTGAEVTPFATVWDHEEMKKYSLSGKFIYPDTALLDSTLTHSLNEKDTLYPALDAASHALESLWNKNATPISQSLAVRALELFNEALPPLLKDQNRLDCRKSMQISSCLAGLAISQTKTAIAHAISYQLTLKYGIPHGLACSFTLPSLIGAFLNATHSIDKNTQSTLVKTKQLLLNLNLNQIIAPYIIKDFNSLYEINISSDRAGNYSGSLELRQIIKDSIS